LLLLLLHCAPLQEELAVPAQHVKACALQLSHPAWQLATGRVNLAKRAGGWLLLLPGAPLALAPACPAGCCQVQGPRLVPVGHMRGHVIQAKVIRLLRRQPQVARVQLTQQFLCRMNSTKGL
jgi:hypothetical protein